MGRIADLLAEFPSFRGLPPEQLREVAAIAVRRHASRGETIFSDGEEGRGFYVVVEGLVKVYKLSPEGKEQTLHVLGPGEPFGQVAVYAGRSFPANAEAIAPTELLFFPRGAFVALITANPSLALSMLAVLSARLREFTDQIEGLALKEVPGRLAAYLLQLAETQGARDAVQLTLRKGEIAGLLGTTPETLSRMLGRLAVQGLIEVDRRTIRLLDPEGLSELAEYGKVGQAP